MASIYPPGLCNSVVRRSEGAMSAIDPSLTSRAGNTVSVPVVRLPMVATPAGNDTNISLSRTLVDWKSHTGWLALQVV